MEVLERDVSGCAPLASFPYLQNLLVKVYGLTICAGQQSEI